MHEAGMSRSRKRFGLGERRQGRVEQVVRSKRLKVVGVRMELEGKATAHDRFHLFACRAVLVLQSRTNRGRLHLSLSL